MKRKILLGLLTLVLTICCLGLVACGNGGNVGGHEHSYQTQVTNPTCTEKGYTTYTCECGDSYVDDYVDEIWHSFTNYISNNNGTKTATCTCGVKDIEDTIVDESVLIVSDNHLIGLTNYGKTLSEIVIPDSVTSIGLCAFAFCSSLTSVIIPDSITSIGDGAFAYCTSLTNITIPDVVTSIGGGAFGCCSSLTNVTISSSVTSIGVDMFYGCSSLTSIEIPDSVTSIGSLAFEDCYKLVEVINKSPYITIEKGSSDNGYLGYYALAIYNSGDTFTGTKISNDNGYIIYIEGEEKILVGYNGTDTDLVLPTYITKINKYAFAYCKSLTSVTLGNSVTSIGDYAFSNCTNLTSVTIGNSVTSIGSLAFYNCRKLVEVINKSPYITIEKGSSGNGYLGYYALEVYNSDSGVTESQLINDNGYIIYIDGEEKILVGYIGTEKELILPTYITKINDCAFYNYDSLTSVTIGNSLTSIGSSAFYNCYRLVEVINKSPHITIVKESSENGYLGYYALAVYNSGDTFTETKLSNDNGYIIYSEGEEKILVGYNGTDTNLVLPTYITKINNCAFYNCYSLTSIEIPDCVTSIGDYAFHGCSSLTSIVIPDSVTCICSYAFYNCAILTTIYCEAESKPSGWSTDWDSKDYYNVHKVIWGYKG